MFKRKIFEVPTDGALVKAAKRLLGRDLRYCGKQHLEFLADMQYTYRASKEKLVRDQLEAVMAELSSRRGKKQSYKLREKQERRVQRRVQRALAWYAAHRRKEAV